MTLAVFMKLVGFPLSLLRRLLLLIECLKDKTGQSTEEPCPVRSGLALDSSLGEKQDLNIERRSRGAAALGRIKPIQLPARSPNLNAFDASSLRM
jgi:hypothetical protein